jgi:hypothetical protein
MDESEAGDLHGVPERNGSDLGLDVTLGAYTVCSGRGATEILGKPSEHKYGADASFMAWSCLGSNQGKGEVLGRGVKDSPEGQ